jgi:hypothetical protein
MYMDWAQEKELLRADIPLGMHLCHRLTTVVTVRVAELVPNIALGHVIITHHHHHHHLSLFCMQLASAAASATVAWTTRRCASACVCAGPCGCQTECRCGPCVVVALVHVCVAAAPVSAARVCVRTRRQTSLAACIYPLLNNFHILNSLGNMSEQKGTRT